jgi:hypothetical protein
MSVKLICIREYSGKLRIRFHSYIDEDKKEYFNVYNNNLNCRFPREIREEGKMYIIPEENVKMSENNGKAPYYIVNTKNMEIIDFTENITKYIETECVICIEQKDLMLYIPCGHVGVCGDCDKYLKQRQCPICRSIITKTLTC